VPAIFVRTAQCPRDIRSVYNERDDLALGRLTRAIGTRPDAFIGEYNPTVVAVPSLRVVNDTRLTVAPIPAPAGFEPEMWTEFNRHHPTGLAYIAATSVRSAAIAEPYDVLPGAAGIAQLLAIGFLERTGRPDRFYSEGLRITGPMHFPAGTGPNLRVYFLLPRGVPFPTGLTRGCVYDEPTGIALVPPGASLETTRGIAIGCLRRAPSTTN
jgi:hypothetical protein